MSNLAVSESITPQFETVDSLQRHFELVFSERNRERLNTVGQCVDLFAVAVRDLHQARRAESRDAEELAIARLGSRIFAFAQVQNAFTFADDKKLWLSDGLQIKYPLDGCAYCGLRSCNCGETRPPARLDIDNVGARDGWSLRNWQEDLAVTYGAVNEQRGFDYVNSRLSSELTEVIVLNYQTRFRKPEEIKAEYPLEVADLAAWTMAAATILDIDMQEVIEDRYGDGCPTCHSMRCRCSEVEFSHVYDVPH